MTAYLTELIVGLLFIAALLCLGGDEADMKKILQNTSITFRMMQHCFFRPTKRSRNKVREIPAEEAVTTYDYSAHIRDVRMMRTRTRSGITEAR